MGKVFWSLKTKCIEGENLVSEDQVHCGGENQQGDVALLLRPPSLHHHRHH